MILFRLTNVSASFQRYIKKIFDKKHDIFDIVYLVNILIYIDNDGNDYVVDVRWVWE